jgi:hypothetical protein
MDSSAGGLPYGVVMQNPPNRRELIFIGTTSIIIIIIGIIATLLTDLFLEIMITGGISLLLLLIIWDKQYRTRSKTAQILKDGILFTYRYGKKDRFVPYSGIYWLMAPPGDPNETNWWDGMMKSLDGTRFILYWSIAIAAKEAYRDAMGKYPPDLYESPWGRP